MQVNESVLGEVRGVLYWARDAEKPGLTPGQKWGSKANDSPPIKRRTFHLRSRCILDVAYHVGGLQFTFETVIYPRENPGAVRYDGHMMNHKKGEFLLAL